MIKILPLALLLAFPARGQPWVSAHWAEIKANMGPIDFDGRLSMALPVGRIEAEGVGWDISLVHTVDVDAYDAPASRWIIPGLMEYLVPEARGSVRVLLPNGRLLHFAGGLRALGPVRDRGGVWLLGMEKGQYTVTSPLGNRYFFAGGQLAKIVTCRGRELRVAAEAGHIRSIVSADAPSRALVASDCDSAGEPVKVEFGGGETNTLTWDHGLLREWDDGRRGRTRFEYRNGMVSRVAAPDRPADVIEWQSVPDWTRWSELWWSPVRVARFNQLAITYGLGHDGALFIAKDAASGRKTVTRFNWFSGVVWQRAGQGEPIIAKYNSAFLRPGFFTRIGRADGKILEAYEYGPDKRLIRITRISEDGRETRIGGQAAILAGWDGEEQSGLPDYEK